MKRLNTFAKVITVSLAITLANGCLLGTTVFNEATKENVTQSEVSTEQKDVVSHSKNDLTFNMTASWSAGATAAIMETVVDNKPVEHSNEPVVQKQETVIVAKPMYRENIITVPSATLRIGNKHIATSPITVNIDRLMKVYYSSAEVKLDWDYKNKPEVWMTIWEFLVNQQGVDPVYAAAICGNVAHEGWFGMEQGTYDIFQNMEDVRSCLGRGRTGYGIVQWTYHTRQENLLAYYELVNQFGLDWDTTMIIAECCCLLEEIKAYAYFSDLGNANTCLEDATGTIAVNYENYRNCTQQWGRGPYGYELIQGNSNGAKRLNYAWKIYYHFGGK